MKRNRIVLLLIICLLCAIALICASCKGPVYVITFVVDGEKVATVTTSGNETIALPYASVKGGYAFEGWYIDDNEDMPFVEDTFADSALNSDLTVYAKFSKFDPTDPKYSWTTIVEPTCTTEGLAERINPFTFQKESEPIYSLGHNYGEFITTQEPTCMSDGSKSKTCLRCGYEITASIPQIWHRPTEWIIVEQATECSMYNKLVQQCKFCETTLITQTEFVDHEFGSDDMCVKCGCSHLSYDYNTYNNTVYVRGFANKDVYHDTLVIPRFERGVEITAISAEAFADCDDLKSLTIPSNIKSIGSRAFYNCDGITEISMPGVQNIWHDAFAYCNGIKSITIPQNVQSIEERAFAYCDNLTTVIWRATACKKAGCINRNDIFYKSDNINEIVIGSNVKSICKDAFYGMPIRGTVRYEGTLEEWCDIDFEDETANPLRNFYDLYVGNQHITELEIPQSVTKIKDYSFCGCKNLVSVTMGDNVLSIGKKSFYGCLDLTSATIGNGVTLLDDGAFGSSSLANVTFGNNIKIFGERAFYGCKFTEFTVPDGVTTLGKEVFFGCWDLKSITISASVTQIGASAFMYYEIDTLNYMGALENWCNIDFVNSYSNPLYFAHSLRINGQLITEVVIPDTVEYIKPYAFARATSITSVVIPNSIKSIDNSAFYGCNGLTSITIPNSVTEIGDYAFYDCRSLTSATIGDNVLSIGSKAFSDCRNLTSLTIGGGVTSIGQNAFENCSNLKTVYYQGPLSDWCNIDFAGLNANPLNYNSSLYIDGQLVTDLVIPDTVEEIKPYAFAYSYDITSVVIPNSVTTIGKCAFYFCYNLSSVMFGDGVTTIGTDAFEYCSDLTNVYYAGDIALWCNISFANYYANPLCNGANLYIDNEPVTELIIPDTFTEIKSNVFYGCTSLVGITIHDRVTAIGDDAFGQCSNLTNVYYAGDLAGWCNISFGYSSFYGYDLYIDNELVTELIIPDTFTEISSNAFYGCKSIINVTIPSSVTAIGDYAFYSCSNLTNVYYTGDLTDWCNINFGWRYFNPLCKGADLYIDNEPVTDLVIPNTVTKIKPNTFSCCASLTSITIPESVTEIGAYAFDNCRGLQSVTIGSSVTAIGSYAFYNCSNLTSVYYTGDLIDWCNINFGNEYANPLYSVHDLYIDGQLITELIIPDTVTEIKPCAFYGCTSITSITIHDGITAIGNYAFYKCSNLANVYYNGTEDDWKKIRIGTYNTDLTEATRYYYSETEPELNSDGAAYNGNYWHYVNGEVTVWKKES